MVGQIWGAAVIASLSVVVISTLVVVAAWTRSTARKESRPAHRLP